MEFGMFWCYKKFLKEHTDLFDGGWSIFLTNRIFLCCQIFLFYNSDLFDDILDFFDRQVRIVLLGWMEYVAIVHISPNTDFYVGKQTFFGAVRYICGTL